MLKKKTIVAMIKICKTFIFPSESLHELSWTYWLYEIYTLSYLKKKKRSHVYYYMRIFS